MTNNSTIQAAGGVVVDLSRGKPRYLLIHRPVYDDWSLPKGKIEDGEKPIDAALREVKEETGLVCEILGKLSTVEYRTPNDKRKRVRYWLMKPVSGSFIRNDEVDVVTWLKRTQAMSLLSYVHDHAVLVEAHVTAKELKRVQKAAARAAAAAAETDA